MITRARSVEKDQIKGMLWAQGESEAMLGLPETYEEKTTWIYRCHTQRP